MRARDIMTSPVITVTPAVPLKGAAALMVSHGFTALPVVDDDKRLVGIITEADLVRGKYLEETGTVVADVMTTPAVAMDAAAPAEVLARVMVDDQRRCVPIVDGSTVIGIVTRRDLVRVIARADTTVAAEVQRVLDMYGGGRKWTVSVVDGEAVIGAATTDEDTERVLIALADAVPGVRRARVLTGGRR
ncbi:CBS domain-containing protein [Lentzea flaviverrucosa]|uniref:CBS domain-containing protein n=1 Tax=Lentzea flaviverrucosa TaxID=200379 RepID=A0A1H9XWC6_9PSEU|nr:CBS domain-containing protein [Lentzea flaviverrucosa]RDI34344.1 CBS domain protein [Lentzea flaviverrucosa]SES50485.1 CBS domain-containing protein [Lentzea flaviverrucosa]